MLQFKLFQSYPELVHGVFDKSSGNVSPRYGSQAQIKKINETIATRLLFQSSVVMVNQVHGNKILVLGSSNVSEIFPRPRLRYYQVSKSPKSADGLVTNLPYILLLIKTADCFPLFIFDPKQNVIGLIHVGWRGAVKGIHLKAISLLKTHFNSHPQDILVGIGPGICSRCFVSDKKPQQSDDPRWLKFISQSEKWWHVDIRGFVTQELWKAGITSHHLEVVNDCTYENSHYFSHQRSKITGEAEGRFGSVIGLKT